jgi:hypothetical protein
VLSYLDVASHARAAQTNRALKAAAARPQSWCPVLVLVAPMPWFHRTLWNIRAHPWAELGQPPDVWQSIGRCDARSFAIQHIRCMQPTTVAFSCTTNTTSPEEWQACLATIAEQTRLQHLSLKIEGWSKPTVLDLQNLRSLQLETLFVDCGPLERVHLPHLPRLRHLKIDLHEQCSEWLWPLWCPQLHSLDIGFQSRVQLRDMLNHVFVDVEALRIDIVAGAAAQLVPLSASDREWGRQVCLGSVLARSFPRLRRLHFQGWWLEANPDEAADFRPCGQLETMVLVAVHFPRVHLPADLTDLTWIDMHDVPAIEHCSRLKRLALVEVRQLPSDMAIWRRLLQRLQSIVVVRGKLAPGLVEQWKHEFPALRILQTALIWFSDALATLLSRFQPSIA